MKRIRIGKDISMRWEITTDGVAIPLEGRDLTIEIKSPAGIENNIPYRVEGNILIMTFYGYEQKRTGEYSITLWEKKGKPGQNVVDVIRAFELVRTSQEEDDFVGGDLQIESVDLGTENFDILTEGGYRAINIDTLQAEALEDSVNIKGKTYSNESFTITLPKANLDSAGVMSASDVRTLNEHADSIARIKTSCEENAADIERVSNVVDTHERRLGGIDAEISSLNTEVSAMQSKVDENTTSISQINNNIADNNKSIAQINTTLEEHTASINAKITTDRIEDGAVTSEKLESFIQSLITNISENASFAGIATTTTNPGTPDGPVFYLATEQGIYSNFSGIELTEGEAVILQWKNGTWSKKTTGLAVQEAVNAIFSKHLMLNGFNERSVVIPDYELLDGTIENGEVVVRDIYSKHTTPIALIKNQSIIFYGNQQIGTSPFWITDADGSFYANSGIEPYKDSKYASYSNIFIAKEDCYVSVTFYTTPYIPYNIFLVRNGIYNTLSNITTEKLADQSVTIDKLSNGAVTSEKIASTAFDDTLSVSKKIAPADVVGERLTELGEYVENPEWIKVITDKDDKIIYGIKTDGKLYFGDGCPPQIKDYIEEKILSLSLDEYEDIVAFVNDYLGSDITLKAIIDGIITTKVNKEEGKSLIDSEYASTKSNIDNTELLEATTDLEGKLLAGRTSDGGAFENVGLSTPKVSIDGSTLENAEDPEGRIEITTDSKGKIISYRDINGVMHEEVGITTKSVAVEHLNISEHGMTEFQQALIESGFNPKSVVDWSDEISLKLPSPKCAKVNFIIQHNYSKGQIQQFKDEGKWPNILLPTTKTTDLECTAEYCDMLGNYYKKPAVLNAQGNSSMKYKIKNLTYDLNDGSEISFGGWVMQDSFHMKFYYQDFLKVYCIAAYRIGEELIKYKNCRSNRNKVGKNDSHWNFGATTNTLENNVVSGALCHPDGFGVEVYINGEYQGLYMMQLKKHRKNYDMNKKNYEEVLIDNVVSFTQPVWTGLEIKNPKTLICMDGTKYDDDIPKELIDITSEFYDPTNKDHKNTVKTKNEILRFCSAMSTITSSENPKEKFLEFFDKDMLEVYFILYEILYGYDNAAGNWVWSCFNKIWAPNFYDLDTTCGKTASGTIIMTNSVSSFLAPNAENNPLGFVWANYKSEIVSLWNELRNKKIIDVDNLISFYESIMHDIGISAYERQYEKYPTLPNYRNSTFNDEVILSDTTKVKRSDYWEVTSEVQDWNEDPTNFDDTKMYVAGDTCKVYVGLYNHIIFRCKQNIPEAGLAPMTFDTYVDKANGEPVSGGFYDSLDRIKKWFNERISFLDTIFVD